VNAKRRKIRVRQLDQQLQRFEPPSQPKGGWFHAIREALGVPLELLAKRLGIPRSNIYQLERAETTGSISIKRLRRAADAINCDVVVTLVPRQPLERMVQEQAIKAARSAIAHTSHSMALEDQALTEDQTDYLVQELAREMIDRGDPRIWQ